MLEYLVYITYILSIYTHLFKKKYRDRLTSKAAISLLLIKTTNSAVIICFYSSTKQVQINKQQNNETNSYVIK